MPQTATVPRSLRLPSPDEAAAGIVIAYQTANFAVYRAVVDRLRAGERFRMETSFGAYEMSKVEFERAFPNIVASSSYSTGAPSMPGRCYHVVGPPPTVAAGFAVHGVAGRASDLSPVPRRHGSKFTS